MKTMIKAAIGLLVSLGVQIGFWAGFYFYASMKLTVLVAIASSMGICLALMFMVDEALKD